MFIDQVKIQLKAGDGGNGCVSFRREKYVPRGGPDGGDGGDGGSIYLEATADMSTLLDLRYQQRYSVHYGQHGRGKDQIGRRSADLVVRVPVGTLVRDLETGELLADLTAAGQRVLAAKGGRGGRGNATFATSTNRAPRMAEPGQPGEERMLQLELKLIADVGLVGFPNAGKSTFLSRISAARPKIGEYPFTTLEPQLGVVQTGDRSFVVADIPGLIEGAHTGKGLGTQFLRHVERTTLLLFLVDISAPAVPDPPLAMEVLRKELGSHDPALLQRPFVVAATKMDAADEAHLAALEVYCQQHGYPLFRVSSVTGAGVGELIRDLGRRVAELRAERAGQQA